MALNACIAPIVVRRSTATGGTGADIQAAIDEARTLNHLGRRVVYVPAGTWVLDSPLYLTDELDPNSFSDSVALIGDRPAYPSASGAVLTQLAATFNDGPIIIADVTRGPHIENLEIVGQNTVTLSSLEQIQRDDVWVSAGVSNDHVGIDIDGRSASAGSSRGVIRNVAIRNVAGGIRVANNGNQQGDVITFDHVSMQDCGRFAYSFGGTQTKGNVIVGGNVDACQYWIDCMRQPSNAGAYPPAVIGGTTTRIQRLFNLGQAIGPFNVSNHNAESFLSIGGLGLGAVSVAAPVVFTSCTFNNVEPITLPHADVHAFVWKPTIFHGCHFVPQSQTGDFTYRFYNGREMVFDLCSFAQLGHNAQVQFDFHTAAIPVDFRNCLHLTDGAPPSNLLVNGSPTATELSLGTETITATASTDEATFNINGVGLLLQRGDHIRIATPFQIKHEPVSFAYTYDGALGVVSDVNGDDITIASIAETAYANLPFTGEIFRRRNTVP